MTDHIKIENTPPRIDYIGNAIQTAFTYPFAIFQSADLIVSLNGAPQVNNFSISGVGNTTGGSVVFDTAPAAGFIVSLERRLPLQRISDFLEGGELAANSLNNELDYLTACLQQVNFDSERMVRLPKGDNGNTTLPAKATRANKAFGFDGAGDITLLETVNTYAAPSVTQTGTGAIARPLTDKAREMVSVKDFGAIGDNVADDTTAIQNALNAHSAIYLPPGTYRITNTLNIIDGKKIVGAGLGSVIKASSNAFDALAVKGSQNSLRDFVVDGGDDAISMYGATSPCADNVFQNLVIKNSVTGILLDGYTNTTNICARNHFSDIQIKEVSQYGVRLTKSGAGNPPTSNSFVNVRVISTGVSISGAGFYAESAKYQNSFVNCEARLAATATACFRIGANSNKTNIVNLQTEAAGTVVNLQLDSGSVDTSIVNLYANSAGTIIADSSGGSYNVINNSMVTFKNQFQRTRISDVQLDLHRYLFESVALGGAGTVNIDLSKSVYFVNATNGVTTMQLPLAAAGNSGAVIFIKKTDAGANSVLVTENGGAGPDAITIRLGTQYDRVMVISDGTAWRVISTNLIRLNTTSVTGVTTYTPDLSRRLYNVNATAALVTVELPPANAATSVGRLVTIKKNDSSANHVRVTENGATGPDAAMVSLTVRYHAVTVMSDGTSWNVLSKYTG